jgi:AcrR family transcriptional regulator
LSQQPVVQDVSDFYRETWISTAMSVLTSDGIEGVRVELLARKLKMTKGAFYHHFKDRDDLLTAMLEHWRQIMVTEIIQDLESIAVPRERFRQLIRVPMRDSRADLEVELAVRLWARRDPRVLKVLEEADALRIDYIVKVITDCGVESRKARARAVLTFGFLRAATAFVGEADLLQCEEVLLSP